MSGFDRCHSMLGWWQSMPLAKWYCCFIESLQHTVQQVQGEIGNRVIIGPKGAQATVLLMSDPAQPDVWSTTGMDVSDAPPDVDPDNIAELSAIPDVWYTANKPAALVKKHKAVGRARREALECGVEGTKKKKKRAVGKKGAPQASNREDTEGESNWSSAEGEPVSSKRSRRPKSTKATPKPKRQAKTQRTNTHTQREAAGPQEGGFCVWGGQIKYGKNRFRTWSLQVCKVIEIKGDDLVVQVVKGSPGWFREYIRYYISCHHDFRFHLLLTRCKFDPCCLEDEQETTPLAQFLAFFDEFDDDDNIPARVTCVVLGFMSSGHLHTT